MSSAAIVVVTQSTRTLEIISANGLPLATAVRQVDFAAKGDLIAGTASEAFDTLTAGADRTILQALASEATGLRWTALPDDLHQTEMVVSPGNTVNAYFFAPYALTVVGVKVYSHSGALSAAGVYTLAVEDIDNSNNLLSAATFDMETSGSLPAATLTTVPLTATTADLDLAAGTRVRIQLLSDNADLVADGVYFQLIYRGQ